MKEVLFRFFGVFVAIVGALMLVFLVFWMTLGDLVDNIFGDEVPELVKCEFC